MLPASPRKEPEVWASFEIGTGKRTFIHPAVPGEGSSNVKPTSGQTIDQAKAAGRDKAKTKLAGRKAIPVAIELIFSARCYDAVGGTRELLEAIHPDGQESGGPFETRAADINWRGVTATVIEEVGPITWRGELGSVSIKAIQWVPEPPKNATGTKTPTKAAPYAGFGTSAYAEGKCTDDGGKTTITVWRKGIKGFASPPLAPNARPPGVATATGSAK